MTSNYHLPVLLDEIVEHLAPKLGMTFVDATFGGGGHSSKFLELGAKVIGFDQDEDAITNAATLLGQYPNQLTLVKDNFSSLQTQLAKLGINTIDAILFDLGVSSHQLDTPNRGFSFQASAPLDMRMDKTLGVTAADLIAALAEKELAKLFFTYGDETRSKAIARKIVNQRKTQPITTTTELANLISQVYRTPRLGKIHVATKVFQALRIAVNDELNSLKDTLPQTLNLLKPNSKLAVISFHSGEDRIVKQFINQTNSLTQITKKPIIASEAETNTNPRARSAKLRIAIKK